MLKRFFFLRARNSTKIITDLILITISYYSAFLLRFDGYIPQEYRTAFFHSLPFVLTIYFVLLYISGLYRGVWRYASIRDLAAIFVADSIGFLASVLVLFESGMIKVPRSVLLIFWCLVLLSVGGIRFGFRIYSVYLPYLRSKHKNVLIIGAGNAGEMISRQMILEPQLGYRPVGFVDDSLYRRGAMLHGIPVLGSVEAIPSLVKRKQADEIIIATPSASASQMRRIVDYCEQSGVRFRILPGPKEIVDGHVTIEKIRDVRIEDLLERAPVVSDNQPVQSYFEDKIVLVTGAAGSIGSELSRQLAGMNLKQVILLDRAESDLFELEYRVRKTAKNPERIVAVLADVTQFDRLSLVFQKYRPDIVFHAAAYKHVPLMQAFPHEAVLNNVFGSINVSRAAAAAGAQRFVLISTDKAVNPTSVMGATKRLSELYCVAQNGHMPLKHIVVRFGNVLASQGSVVPRFQEQIRNGGPITVTSKEIARYFMTIPEAVELVLHAAIMGNGGEIFILDMGEPIKIYDMAKHLVALSGLELGKDVEIEITGLRPGEKLFEELWNAEENPSPTIHPKILKSAEISVNGSIAEGKLSNLYQAAMAGDQENIYHLIRKMVPTFQGDYE